MMENKTVKLTTMSSIVIKNLLKIKLLNHVKMLPSLTGGLNANRILPFVLFPSDSAMGQVTVLEVLTKRIARTRANQINVAKTANAM